MHVHFDVAPLIIFFLSFFWRYMNEKYLLTLSFVFFCVLFRAHYKKLKQEKVAAAKAAKKLAEERSYDRLFEGDGGKAMVSNHDFEATEDASAAMDFEDDFM